MISYDFTKLYIQLTTVILPRRCSNAPSNSHCFPIMSAKSYIQFTMVWPLESSNTPSNSQCCPTSSTKFYIHWLWFTFWGRVLLTHLVIHAASLLVLQTFMYSLLCCTLWDLLRHLVIHIAALRFLQNVLHSLLQFTLWRWSNTPSTSHCFPTISKRFHVKITTCYPLGFSNVPSN